MKVTESRLRKTIRQVIRESVLKNLSRKDLYKELIQLGHGVDPYEASDPSGFKSTILEDHCGGVDYKFGFEYGTVYNAVHDACEAISPGSRDSDLLVLQTLQSNQKYDVINLTVEILIHEHAS